MNNLDQDTRGEKKKAVRQGRLDKERFSEERIGQNIRQQHSLGREVDRLASDQAKLAGEECDQPGASRQWRRWLNRQQNQLAGRELRLRERDDAFVEEALKRKISLEGAFNAEGTTDVDELLYVMESDLKVLPLLAALQPPDTHVNEETGQIVKARFMYPSLTLNLVSVISRYLSAASGPEMMSVVLTDPRYMGLRITAIVDSHSGPSWTALRSIVDSVAVHRGQFGHPLEATPFSY